MRDFSFVLIILILSLASRSIQAQSKGMKTGTSTVSGYVTLDGKPARGVMVVLQTKDQKRENEFHTSVDEVGQFHFSGIPAGEYSVFPVAPGYFSPGDNPPYSRGKRLNIADREKVENIDIEIKRGGVIAGKVTDTKGLPVIEEPINLRRQNENDQKSFDTTNAFQYQTDDRGFYRIYGLPEGRYLVSVGVANTPIIPGIPGREFYPLVFYKNAANESEATAIEVHEGSEADDIDITVTELKHTCDIVGRVVDPSSGQQVSGVQFRVLGVREDGAFTGQFYGVRTQWDKNGEFKISGVAPGKYAVFARSDNTSGANGEGYISDPVIVDVKEGPVTRVEIKARQGASISGIAVIEGTNDQNVKSKLSQIMLHAFVGPAGHGSVSSDNFAKINTDGSFLIRGLTSGKAVISNSGPPEMAGYKIVRIERDYQAAPGGIDVVDGEQVTGVRIVFAYGNLSIRGELKVAGGVLSEVYKFIWVHASRIDQPYQTYDGVLDARGKFVIENLSPGEYAVHISYLAAHPELRRMLYLGEKRVVLSGDNSTPVALTLDPSEKEKDR